jgi:hypothetical protein
MSTDGSYYDIHRVSPSCEPNQENDALAYTVLDSAFYDHTLPVSVSESCKMRIIQTNLCPRILSRWLMETNMSLPIHPE